MRVLLLQLDGKLPNLALLRIARHHRSQGDEVELRRSGNAAAVQPRLGEPRPDKVYASAIFTRTEEVARAAARAWPGIELGGTGIDARRRLEDIGIAEDGEADYSDWPQWRSSLGFTQRGCRLRCGFCVVPRKEGKVRSAQTIAEIWRGSPWPREIVLLDNDFFGNAAWPERIDELNRGRFRVCLTQGINARLLTDEAAAALASLDYRDSRMVNRRLYTALDNPKDTGRFIRGLERLTNRGVRPRHLCVYLLIGYWAGEQHADREARLRTIRQFGAMPYPMPYRRTPELMGFARWVIGGYDRTVSWQQWEAVGYRPTRLRVGRFDQPRLELKGTTAGEVTTPRTQNPDE